MVRDTLSIVMLLILVVIVHGCKGKDTAIPEGNSPEGKVYKERCGICHPIPQPSKYPFERWRDFLGLMDMEMMRKGVPPLSQEEKRMILKYLKRHSSREEGV